MAQNGGEINRKSEKVRRANRLIQNRTMILMAVLGVLVDPSTKGITDKNNDK